MKIYKTMASFALASVLLLTGCNNTNGTSQTSASTELVIDTATKEIRQNDFRGGVMRTYAIQENILTIMEGMKRNNIAIREDNPNSYWTTNGYQDFVSTFLTAPIINDTQWFNEEETDWQTLVAQMLSVSNSFTIPDDNGEYKSKISSSLVVRNEKDDYSISGLTDTVGDLSGSIVYRILYDCDKDWCKAYTTMDVSGADVSDVTSQLYEYARISNDIFAIQTAKERLLVVLEHVDEDTDLRERPIKEFYYSRLSGGQRTTFKPYEPLPEEEEDGTPLRENQRYNQLRAKYPLLNEFGEIATQYGVKNSIFTQEDVGSTNYPWVFEDGALQQAIVYKQNTLVVTTYNKLSEKYERFIYSTEKVDNKLIAEIEDMVNIEGLVGVVEVKKSEDVPTSDNEASASVQTAEVSASTNDNQTSGTTDSTPAVQPHENLPIENEPNSTSGNTSIVTPQTGEASIPDGRQNIVPDTSIPFTPATSAPATPANPDMNQEARGTE